MNQSNNMGLCDDPLKVSGGRWFMCRIWLFLHQGGVPRRRLLFQGGTLPNWGWAVSQCACRYLNTLKRLAPINFTDTYFPSMIQIVKFLLSIITFQAGWLDGPTGEIGPSANRSQLVARASSSATATATLQHLTLVKAIQSRQLCVHPLSLLSKYQQGQHPIQVRIL